MEISNEIKAKVFANYLGQKIVTRLRGYDLEKRRTSSFKEGVLIEVDLTHNQAGVLLDEEKVRENLTNLDPGTDCQMLLRPLSEITDEDAIEVCKMVVSSINYPRRDYKITRHNTSVEVKLDNSHFTDSVFIGHTGNVWTSVKHPRYGNNVFTFFSDRGYDQMHHLLNGLTLREAGLAIYKQD